MMNAIHRHALYAGSLMLALSCGSVGAPADEPAGRDADRQAQTAVPRTGEALIYVYRAADAHAAPIAVTIAGAETQRLAPATFALWRVKPQRHELRAERGNSIALQSETGRVYYVELARAPSGAPVLRPVSFATGRAQVQRSRLVGPALAAARPRAAASAPSADSRTHGAFMFKLGSFNLADDSQSIPDVAWRFDSSASSVFAVEGEWFFRPDTSLGGELFRYSNALTDTTGVTGEMDTTVFLANIKRYFVLADEWRPYVGAGAGIASADFSGAVTGSTSGLALQVTGGLQWRRGQFALRGEYKYLRAKTEDDNSNKIDASGSGLFLGAGFYF